jgi:hypothetical protein
VQLRAPEVAVAPGAEVVVEVRAVGVDQRPRAGVAVTVWDAPLGPGAAAPRTHRGRTDGEGKAQLRWTAAHPGAHRLRAEVATGEAPGAAAGAAQAQPATAEAALAVAEGPPEDLDLRPDGERLERLAALAGGLAVADAGALPSDALLGPRPPALERIRHELWGHPLVLLCLLALLGTEWALRRRWGAG